MSNLEGKTKEELLEMQAWAVEERLSIMNDPDKDEQDINDYNSAGDIYDNASTELERRKE